MLVAHILRRLRLKVPEVPAPIFPSDVERKRAKAIDLGSRAVHSYQPTAFDQRIVLVHATDIADYMEIADPSGTCGWGEVCAAGVDRIQITCNHHELLKEPNISEIAQRIEKYLD
jgi:thioesterase domain-containing protein